MKRRILRLLMLGLLIAIPATLGLGLVQWYSYRAVANSQSAERIELEHGVVLPASISNIKCEGNASEFWLIDRWARSTFELNTADLVAFQSQLQIDPSSSTLVSGNTMPTFDKSAKLIHCVSITGDGMLAEFWKIDEQTVGVRLHTDWN